jgi:peptidoglycan/LPS O-acetylase OafA/YrhL
MLALAAGTLLLPVIAVAAAVYAANYAFMTYIQTSGDLGVIGASWLSVKSPALVYSTFAHLPHFLFGVGAAWFYLGRLEKAANRPQTGLNRHDIAFWLAGAAIFAVLATEIDDYLGLPFGRYNFPIISFLIAVILVSVPHAPIARRLLESVPLRFLGVISYGIYIYHYPVLQFCRSFMRRFDLSAMQDWLLFGIMGFAMTIGLAVVSYFIVERPVMRWFRRHEARFNN